MAIEKVNITNQVIEYLKQNIANGNWTIGEKIPSENQLTVQLQVSRASVRAAIQHLIGIGILESVHGKGTFLVDTFGDENKITAKDCQDIYKVLEFRRILESEACYLATQHAGPQFIKKLKKYLAHMMECRDTDNKEEFVSTDIKFHKEICKASDNQLISKSMNKVFEEHQRNHKQLNDLLGYNDGIYFHSAIIEAIEKKDANYARSLMYDHLQSAISRLGM